MIIYWGAERSEELPIQDHRFETIVSELLRARRRGHHLVVMEETVCASLRELQLSGKEIALLDRLSDEYTQTGGAIEYIKPAIRIINSLAEEVVHEDGVFNVSLGTLLASKILEEPKFVLENQKRDGFLFEFALRKISCHPIAFDFVHGGGADISDVFEGQIRQKRVVACSVDSDRYTPVTLKNEKLSQINTRLKRISWPLGFAMSPECREIENLIPSHVVSQLPSGKSCKSNDVIQKICESEGPDQECRFWSFFDIKKGIVHKKIRALTGDEFTWVREKLLLGGIDLSAITEDELGDDPDSHIYLPGYGDKVVDQIQRAQALHGELAKAIVSKNSRDAFSDVFNRLLAIFASTEELLT